MKACVTVAALLVACGHGEDASAGGAAGVPPPGAAKLRVTSGAFASGAEIPSAYTCEGADTLPPLAVDGAPAGAKATAYIVDDPDAPDPAKPQRTWVHFVRVSAGATTIDGNNDWGTPGWRGPCPPIGRHRYVFKVYALDAQVGHAGMTKAELLAAMKGHVLGYGELIGTYQKHKP